jgi:hypothetical protein
VKVRTSKNTSKAFDVRVGCIFSWGREMDAVRMFEEKNER